MLAISGGRQDCMHYTFYVDHLPFLPTNFSRGTYAAFSRGVNPYYMYSTTFTCDKYTHHVVMDTFLNANHFRNKDLRVPNHRWSDHHVFLIISSGIPLSQIFVFRVICILKSVHHDVVGILVTNERSWEFISKIPSSSCGIHFYI